MAVSHVVSVSHDTGTGSVTTNSVTLPTGSPGANIPAAVDIALLVVTNERGSPPSLPAGWTTLVSEADSTNLSRVLAWKRLTTGDLGSTITATWGATRRSSIACSVFRGGADPVHQQNTFSTIGSGTAVVTGPSITPSADDAMLVSVGHFGIFSAPLIRTFTPGSGWTEQVDDSSQSTSSTNALTHISTKLLSGQNGVSQTGETKTCSNNQFFQFMETVSLIPGGPTGDAGADQSNIEPFSTVTLVGTGTGTWSQTAGSPSVTLGGSGNTRTFAAPGTIAGTTLSFGFGGDEMSVTVLPATERMVVGGVEVALQTLQVSS